jgi:integrase
VAEGRELRHSPTVSDLAKRFLEEHVPQRRASVQPDYRSMVRVIEGALGSRKVASVTLEDVEKLHRKITNAGHHYRANRLASLASKMFALSIKWKMRTDNPCRGLERNPESKRERYLSEGELARLSAALAAHPDQEVADVFRLLLFTGSRAGEVVGATWDQFNLEAPGRWKKPAANTKTKKDHTVPLSEPARKLLRGIYEKQAHDETHVFPNIGPTGAGQRLNAHWAQICKAANITGLRIHDLRHSYASTLASAGYSLPVIGAVGPHASGDDATVRAPNR